MGRAIDMENELDKLKMEVRKLENIVRGMSHNMGLIGQKSSKVSHVDLVDDVKTENKEESENGSKEKANDEGDGTSNE